MSIPIASQSFVRDRTGPSFSDFGGRADTPLIDQHTQLQAYINAIGESDVASPTCVLPPGTIRSSGPLVFPRTMSVVGEGTVLQFPTDLGAGQYALAPVASFAMNYSGLRIVGPATGTTTGVSPAAMSGILIPSQCFVRNVAVSGFHAGVECIGDHMTFADFDFRGNGYAVNFADFHPPQQTSTGGDILFERGLLTSCTLASVGLADTNCVLGARFRTVHFGYAPYGIKRYATGNTTGNLPRDFAFDYAVLESCPFESCGHAAIYDEAGGALWSMTLDIGGAVNVPDPNFAVSGEPTDLATFEVGSAAFTFANQEMPLPGPGGRPLIRAETSIACSAPSCNTAAGWLAAGPTTNRLFEITAAYNSNGSELREVVLGRAAPGVHHASASVAHAAVTRGDLLEHVGYGHVQPYSGSAGSHIAGFALHTVPLGTPVCFAMHSPVNGGAHGANKTASAIPGNRLLKPDPANSGGVIAASGPSDGPIVGSSDPGGIGAGITAQIRASVS